MELTEVIEKQKNQLEIKEKTLLQHKDDSRQKNDIIIDLEKKLKEIRSTIIKEDAQNLRESNEKQRQEFDDRMLVVEA
jgi:hypothetical protein